MLSMNEGHFVRWGAHGETLRLRRATGRGSIMKTTVKIEIKLDVAACLYGIAAILAVLV